MDDESDTVQALRAAVSHGSDVAELRRLAYRLLGTTQSEKKRRASVANGKLGGRPQGTPTPQEARDRQSEIMKAVWENKRETGDKIMPGRPLKPLQDIRCDCGEALIHKSRCPRGRAIRRRESHSTGRPSERP